MRITALFILFLVLFSASGCIGTHPENKIPKDDTRRVRVSGDLTVEAGSRRGL